MSFTVTVHSAITKHCRYALDHKSEYDEKSIIMTLPSILANKISFSINNPIMLQIRLFDYIKNKRVALYIFQQMESNLTK